jgi:gamma-glutamyl-gamma-aminobutyrate hydrolase PuuD
VLGRTFAVGVQWHPEENGDVRLFAGLVDAARSVQGRRARSAR